MHEVPIAPRSNDALEALVDEDDIRRYRGLEQLVGQRLRGHQLWHVNSTAEGGGVAELLASCLGYLSGAAIDTRWLVMEADPSFFDISKRIHNRLHGDLGDGGSLGDRERRQYERTAARNLELALEHIDRGDLVVVHDPQPMAMVPGLAAAGATVIWTCHVGVDVPNEVCRSAWDFLRPYAEGASALTFTRRAYVWEGLDAWKVSLTPPCIDGLSIKNRDLELGQREAILGASGVVAPGMAGRPVFTRPDGAEARVVHEADITEAAPVPAGAPLVLQVSRWDRLKDPRGVLAGFAQAVEEPDAHLMLAGPAPSGVADDPEAADVFADITDEWEALRPDLRRRVHLANLPTTDVDENAAIVNALQRRADVIVQKSLAEGFGLTVTEAMWKERPVVASGVGGIQDQIEHGVHGLLVDPRDLTAFGNAVESLLRDPTAAHELGVAAPERVSTTDHAPH
jgi:trehalose synthase